MPEPLSDAERDLPRSLVLCWCGTEFDWRAHQDVCPECGSTGVASPTC
jgi:hypothetical protein